MLRRIALFQFKNYGNRSFEFPSRITGIWGRNGIGKTNLLDAIHYLCFTKSYFSRLDTNSVQQGKSGFRIEGDFELGGIPEKTTCILRESGKKEFTVNGEPYQKFSQHIGRYPCVVIAPDDAALITGGSEERRKFLDALLAQLDGDYLQHLITYTRILQQRNALLNRFAEQGTRDFALLDVLDEQLSPSAKFIADRRKQFLVEFLPMVKHLYQEIANQPENVNLFYESELLVADFQQLLKANRARDCQALRTTAGPHRDDLLFQLGQQLFRTIASQGQRKSLLFALKIAEMEVLKKEKGFPPLLLLDDVFEKLDEERIGNLLSKVCNENEGQVFITDTNGQRLEEQLTRLGVEFIVMPVQEP